jgi:hypothetical protein
VGLLDFFRRKPLAAQAVVEVRPAAPPETVGVSGTTNWNGRVLAERNAALRDEQGYGQAGTENWGEWEEIRRANPWVAAGVNFVLAPLQEARLDVAANPKHPNPALAQQQADFVRWNLELLETQLRGRAADGMLASGFSLFEHAWAQKPRPEVTGLAHYIPSLEERLPVSLSPTPWKEDERGHLIGVEQSAPKPGGAGWHRDVMPADRLVRFVNDESGRNYAGFSAFRAVWYIAGRVQPELLRLIGVTYQREGAGVPTAVATDPKTPLNVAQREALEQLLANLVFHENASIVMPAGWDLKWVFAPGANKGHVLEAWKQLGVVVLQQVGAQQLALGTGDTGSRSVGEVHDARAAAYVKKVAGLLARGLEVLTKRLVDANWGPQDEYPTARFTLKRPELPPVDRVNALSTAKGSGLVTWLPSDENALREELSLAPISEEELAEAKAAQPKPPPAPGVELEDDEGEGKDEDGEDQPPSLKASTSGSFVSWRPLRASEKRTDFASIDAYLAGRREAFERAVKPVVVTMLARAQMAIADAMKDGDPSEVAELPLDTAELDTVVAKYLADVRMAGGAFARKELRKESGEKLAEDRREVLSAAAEEEDDKTPAEREVESDTDDLLDAQRVAVVRRMTSRLRSELETEALDVVRTGGDALEVLTRVVTRQLETGAYRTDAGAVVARIFNGGRDEAARIVGGVQAVEYSALLDSRVCSPCRNMDGRTAPFGSAAHDAMVPPNRDCDGGANCRCLLVFIPEGGE